MSLNTNHFLDDQISSHIGIHLFINLPYKYEYSINKLK